ncbi:unnamed protein product [Clavelina lepadiformis]|uniref:Uncharacterized protein n=1 Tax=Clavelina lepadiformis TaxID=159417 RepID=A0ABP0EZP7_CLALP
MQGFFGICACKRIFALCAYPCDDTCNKKNCYQATLSTNTTIIGRLAPCLRRIVNLLPALCATYSLAFASYVPVVQVWLAIADEQIDVVFAGNINAFAMQCQLCNRDDRGDTRR